jgi:hypothetical protein
MRTAHLVPGFNAQCKFPSLYEGVSTAMPSSNLGTEAVFPLTIRYNDLLTLQANATQ